MSDNLLKIINLSKIYDTQKQRVIALNNINLNIKQGEIISLLGPNGAGKTTLSSILATLHPPTSGDVLYKDESIYKDIIEYRKHLGYCPQKPNLDPYLNVEENLIFAGRYFLIPDDVIKERMNFLLEQLYLTQYAKFNINALSGGTRQRVLIARALIHNPDIIILDEPTVGLDPDVRRQLWNIIKSLKEKGVTIIITTHYLDEAEVLSDRICILDKGKIVLTETVANLKEQHKLQNLEEIFLSIMEKAQKQNGEK